MRLAWVHSKWTHRNVRGLAAIGDQVKEIAFLVAMAVADDAEIKRMLEVSLAQTSHYKLALETCEEEREILDESRAEAVRNLALSQQGLINSPPPVAVESSNDIAVSVAIGTTAFIAGVVVGAIGYRALRRGD